MLHFQILCFKYFYKIEYLFYCCFAVENMYLKFDTLSNFCVSSLCSWEKLVYLNRKEPMKNSIYYIIIFQSLDLRQFEMKHES